MGDVVLNYWAILVAAVAQFVLGMLWYSPLLFGRSWMKLMKVDEANMKGSKKDMGATFFMSFLSSLVLSYVLAHFVSYLGLVEIEESLEAAFWIWLGFVAMTHLSGVIYEKKPFQLYAINMAYYLGCLLVSAAILVSWVV